MIGVPLRYGRQVPRAAFTPLSLFRQGEQGVWFDPNDLSTLFQDSAGTTPVTAAGQPVGLMLDKRLGQPTARRNLLVYSQQFDNAAWTKAAASVVSAGDGSFKVVEDTANAQHVIYQTTSHTLAAVNYTASADAKAAERQFIRLQIETSAGAVYAGARFNLATGQIVSNDVVAANGAANPVARISPASDGFYRIELTALLPAGALARNTIRLLPNDTGFSYPGDGVSGAFVKNAQLERSGTATAYQQIVSGTGGEWTPGNHAFQSTAASRPMLRQNATTGAFYLETDGSDDWMSTSAINFTATDKVSVFAGVRKLSDSAPGTLLELSTNSNTNPGTFAVFAPVTTFSNYAFRSFGSVTQQAQTSSMFPAPISNVLATDASISGDRVTLRVNGAPAASNAGDQGTGNYGNYPLYLFRRAGTSLPFNGHFYGLTIVGRLCSDAETRNVERLYAAKTGVVLS